MADPTSLQAGAEKMLKRCHGCDWKRREAGVQRIAEVFKHCASFLGSPIFAEGKTWLGVRFQSDRSGQRGRHHGGCHEYAQSEGLPSL